MEFFFCNLTEHDLKFLSLSLREVCPDVFIDFELFKIWLNVSLFTSDSSSLLILVIGLWVTKLRSLLLIVLLNSASALTFEFIESLDFNSLGSSF